MRDCCLSWSTESSMFFILQVFHHSTRHASQPWLSLLHPSQVTRHFLFCSTPGPCIQCGVFTTPPQPLPELWHWQLHPPVYPPAGSTVVHSGAWPWISVFCKMVTSPATGFCCRYTAWWTAHLWPEAEPRSARSQAGSQSQEGSSLCCSV